MDAWSGHVPGCRLHPRLCQGTCRRQPIHVSLTSMLLSLSHSLFTLSKKKSTEKTSRVRINETKRKANRDERENRQPGTSASLASVRAEQQEGVVAVGTAAGRGGAGSRVGVSTQERVTQVGDGHSRAHESDGGRSASAAHRRPFPVRAAVTPLSGCLALTVAGEGSAAGFREQPGLRSELRTREGTRRCQHTHTCPHTRAHARAHTRIHTYTCSHTHARAHKPTGL